MRPNVDACARFTTATGRPSAIGALTNAGAILRADARTAITSARNLDNIDPRQTAGTVAFLHAHAEKGTQPVVIVVTHGHFSRILAARALGLAPEYGRLFASTTTTVSLIEDHNDERRIRLGNADAALHADTTDPTAHPASPDPLAPTAGLLS